AGPDAAGVIQDIFNVTVETDSTWRIYEDNLIIRIDEQRYECWLIANHAESIWQKLSASTAIANENLWTLLDIRAGLGNITLETFEAFTPQAINFQLVNGINFRKGCYTGQEIVARLHYRGILKRHMYRFEFALNGDLPKPGSELKNAAGKSVGEIVLAARTNSERGELLASVVDDQRVDIYLPDNPQKLGLLPLPYAIPTPNEDD
ncbi:MAG: folate-binding protein, partial [Moraxellaceae bacterium]